EHYFLRLERHARSGGKGDVRIECADSLLSVILPIYGTERRHADLLLQVRRQRPSERRALRHVQVQRMDRDSRFGNGGSQCVWLRRLRSQEVQRVCVWHGCGTNRDSEVWN